MFSVLTAILDTEFHTIFGDSAERWGLGYSLSRVGLFGEFTYIIVWHFYLFKMLLLSVYGLKKT